MLLRSVFWVRVMNMVKESSNRMQKQLSGTQEPLNREMKMLRRFWNAWKKIKK